MFFCRKPIVFCSLRVANVLRDVMLCKLLSTDVLRDVMLCKLLSTDVLWGVMLATILAHRVLLQHVSANTPRARVESPQTIKLAENSTFFAEKPLFFAVCVLQTCCGT